MRKSNQQTKQTKQTMKMAAPGTSTQSWKAMIGSALTTVATSKPYLATATIAVLAGVVGASKYYSNSESTTVAATSVAAAALMAITYMAGGSMLIVGGISALAVAAVAVYEYTDNLQGALYSLINGSSAECSANVGKEDPAAFPANSAAGLEAGGTPALGGAGSNGPQSGGV